MSHFLSQLHPVFTFPHMAFLQPPAPRYFQLDIRAERTGSGGVFWFLLFFNEMMKRHLWNAVGCWQVGELTTCEETLRRSSEILLLKTDVKKAHFGQY